MAEELHPSDLLEVACSGDVDKLRNLLDVSSTDLSGSKDSRTSLLNVTDVYGRTACCLAVDQNRVTAIQTLASAGADISSPSKDGMTPVMVAIARRNFACVRELIKLGADINCVNSKGRNALIIAAATGQENCIKLLIDVGADVNVRAKNGIDLGCEDYLGRTALMYAAQHHRKNCMKMLLQAGADVNLETSDGETALHWLVKQVSREDKNSYTHITECMKILIHSGADVMQRSHKGQTVLMFAARNDRLVPLLPILLKAGAVVDQQDSSGMTALVYAVSEGSHAFVRWLVQFGASVNICDYSGKTPLHYLIYSSKIDENADKCLEILLNKQADVNARDNEGMTPLMYVARKPISAERTMAMLLKHGANLDSMDDRGQTALIHSLGISNCPGDCIKEYNPFIYHDMVNKNFLYSMGANFNIGKLADGRLSNLVYLPYDLDLVKLRVGNGVNLDVSWDDFTSMFITNKKKILLFLIIHGVMPSQPARRYRSQNYTSHHNTASLLRIPAKVGNFELTKYLIATCYLTTKDIMFPFVRFLYNFQAPNDRETLKEIQNCCSQPWPLVKLCFVTVSTVFGASPGRQERVKNSQLPPKLQNMLLFKEPWSRLCVHQWDKIPLTFNPEEYEKLPRPRPLLYHWPVGRALVPCDCGECDGSMYKYEIAEKGM